MSNHQPNDDTLEILRDLGIQVEAIPEAAEERPAPPATAYDQSGQQNQNKMSTLQPDILEIAMKIGFQFENAPEETPDAGNPNAEKPEDAKVHDNWFLDDEVPTTSTSKNFDNFPDNDGNGMGYEAVSSENPNAEKPDHSNILKEWESVAKEAPPMSSTEYNEKMIEDLMNSPNFQEDCLKFLDEKVLYDENLMEEYEKGTADNSPQCETIEESPQEMLDPHFETQNYVLKDQEDTNALHTIKLNQLVKLTVSPSLLEEQNLLICIYHSHPDFVDRTISGVSKDVVKETPPPNNTPFSIGYNNTNVHYRDLTIPFMEMNLKGALVNLKKAKSLFVKFLLNSTDPYNHGKLKDAKEWHLLVIPVSKSKAQNIIQNSSQPTELSQAECIPLSILRIQVKTKVRKNQKLQKPHRGVELEWPLYQSTKRQRLEREYFQIRKRKIASMTDEELEQKMAKLC